MVCKSPTEAFKGRESYAEANIGAWNGREVPRRYLCHPSSPDEELCSCQNASQGFGECVSAGDRVRYARPNHKLIVLSLTIDVARAKNPQNLFVTLSPFYWRQTIKAAPGLNDLSVNEAKLNVQNLVTFLC